MSINMSNVRPMVSAGNSPRVRYSAAYPTGAERFLDEVEKVGGGGHWTKSILLPVRLAAC